RNGQSNRVFELIAGKDCAHVEIVSHDETIKTEFAAQQIGNDPTRQSGRRLFRFKAGIPAMTDHQAIYDLIRTPRWGVRTVQRAVPTNKFAKYGELILIQLFTGAVDPRQFVVCI